MKVNFTLFEVCFQPNFSELAKKKKKKKKACSTVDHKES